MPKQSAKGDGKKAKEKPATARKESKVATAAVSAKKKGIYGPTITRSEQGPYWYIDEQDYVLSAVVAIALITILSISIYALFSFYKAFMRAKDKSEL